MRRRLFYNLLLGGCALAWLLAALTTAKYASLDADEGFYLYSSWAVLDGQFPYRDFAYTQTPLYPYFIAPFLSVLPTHIGTTRGISCVILLLSLIALERTLSRVLPFGVRIPLLLITFSNPSVLCLLSLGKAHTLAFLFLTLAGCSLFSDRSPQTRLLLAGVLCLLSIAARLPTAPAVAVLLTTFWFQHRKSIQLWKIVSSMTVGALGVILPFLLLVPERFTFWTLLFHLSSERIPDYSDYLFRLGTEFPVFVVIVVLLPWLFLIDFKRNPQEPGLPSLLGAGIGVVTLVLLAPNFVGYVIPFSGLFVLGLGVHLKNERVQRRTILGICALTLFAQFNVFQRPHTLLDFGLHDAFQEATRVLETSTSDGDFLIVFAPEIAAGAGRRLPGALAMGQFGLTADMPSDSASSLGLLHVDLLESWLSHGKPAALVLSRGDAWNFESSFPSWRPISSSVRERLKSAIDSHYEPVLTNKFYVVLVRRNAISGLEGEPPDAQLRL